jgi:hypothetical protein
MQMQLGRESMDAVYMRLYAIGQVMHNQLCGQISYNIALSNGFKSALEYNLKLFLVEMKAATRKDIAEHVIRLAKVIPASVIMVSYV